MKKFHLAMLLSIILSLFIYHTAYSTTFKWIKVGWFWDKVVDSGDQGESSGEGTFLLSSFDNFLYAKFDHAGYQLGTKDWTDANGKYWPYKISGAGHGTCNELTNTIPVEDKEGYTIRKYFRYQPPTIKVDGYILNEPMLDGDFVDPTKIPGTADVMVESFINTSMGLTIDQKVFGWSQINHDDYLIYDWTFTNTGNIDGDSDIELPTQTLKDVYFLRAVNWYSGTTRPWNSAYGEFPGDSLRITYAYPQKQKGTTFDEFGDPRTQGYLRRCWYIGEAMLHVDKSATDHSNNPAQPQMTGFQTAELLFIKNEADMNSPDDHASLYKTMKEGFLWMGEPEMTGTYPGHHTVRMDERGIRYVLDFSWWNWRANNYTACGPYTLAPGQSFRIVYAQVLGTISIEKSFEIGTKWQLKQTLEPPPGMVFGVKDNLPQPFKDFPQNYAADSRSSESNNWAKDCWVCTGKDSLFKNSWNAQWNVRNNYNVPMAPPAPSIEINSRPDKVVISWGKESESASDFAGYRVYRALGASYYNRNIVGSAAGPETGKWGRIFECGKGTANPTVTHVYEDKTAERGKAYFYYVAAFDDGVGNIADVSGKKESLESGMYLNMARTKSASLTRSAGTLPTARVVPNPYNYAAQSLQFPGEPDKIMFLDIPGFCTIKIYSESLDLVQVIEHTNGSGDQSWGLTPYEHTTTITGQRIVSGIYIAHIQENSENGTPTGNSINLKFIVIR